VFLFFPVTYPCVEGVVPARRAGFLISATKIFKLGRLGSFSEKSNSATGLQQLTGSFYEFEHCHLFIILIQPPVENKLL
jgi:hypothetical protein